MENKTPIELLAPAGDYDALKAAIAAGANAVYFGLEKFSARTRAKNISLTELAQLAPIAKTHNVKMFITLNTLLTDDELEPACALIKAAVPLGIDAVIVQDIGILTRLQEQIPQVELHASTQMTTHNIEQCRFLAELGVSQVNLSRELSLTELKPLMQFLIQNDIVPEVFVHGAYCISFSGQCYLSGLLYGEHGNRGSCVQPCRRQYSLSISGKKQAPFHLKDNCAFPLAKELIEAGAGSLKIEGRIKNAEYVWAVTSAWRKQIDTVSTGKKGAEISPYLTGTINRDFSSDYLRGTITEKMFSNGEKDISLQNAGTVISYHADSSSLTVKNCFLKTGDRITIKTKDGMFICTGSITARTENADCFTLHMSNKRAGKILGGHIVWRSTSVISPDELSAILKKFEPQSELLPKSSETSISLKVRVWGNAGTVLSAQFIANTLSADNNFPKEAIVLSHSLLAKAHNGGLTTETIRDKLGRLGGTSFILQELDLSALSNGLFIPPAELNAMRREAVAILSKATSDQNETQACIQKKVPQKEISHIDSIRPFQAAFICADIVYAQQLSAAGYITVLQLPLVLHQQTESFLIEHPDIIPAFESILIGSDFTDAKALIQKLAVSPYFEKRRIWCENTGLAHTVCNAHIPMILGSSINITNSAAAARYCTELCANTFVPSIEISAKTASSLCIPDGCSMWFPLYENERLMQSRQCLVKKLSGCTKSETDRNCIFTCNKEFSIDGMNGEKIIARKRPGYYSALYPQQIVSNTAMYEELKQVVSVWTVDTRFFTGNVLSLAKDIIKGIPVRRKDFIPAFETRHYFI